MVAEVIFDLMYIWFQCTLIVVYDHRRISVVTVHTYRSLGWL